MSVIERDGFREEMADERTHKRFFVQFHKWFPEAKKREQRLGILMALIGYPILSQSEIDKRIMHILIEVTNDPSAYLTAKLSAEIQAVVASETYGPAWLIPAASYESLAVSDLRGADSRESTHGHARSLTDPGAREKQSGVELADLQPS